MLLQILYFLQYYFEFKTIETLYYALFIFCNLIYNIFNFKDFFLQNFFLHNDSFLNIDYILSIGFYYLFIKHLLNINNKNKKLNKLFNTLTNLNIVLLLIFTILAMANISSNVLLWSLIVLFFPVYVYGIFKVNKIKLPYTKYVTVAVLFLTICMSITAFLSLLNNYKYPMSNWEIDLPLQIGLLADLILFSIAIHKKYSAIRY